MPPAPAPVSTKPVHIVTDYREAAAAFAKAYGLNVHDFVWVVGCESHFNPHAIGDTDPRYGGASYGIAQIHLVAHPNITKAEAFNAGWSLKWMAQQWAAGHADEWSCYRILTK